MAATQERPTVIDPMTKAQLHPSTQPGYYQRIVTAWRSFTILKDLTPEQVDSFMKSYVIYDLDWKDEKQMIEVLGPNYQERVGQCLADYYRVLNHLCAIGELEKMYVPPIIDLNHGITGNQILYEELIAEELQLPPNAKVLDIGCGRGRVAAHMTEMTGAKVTGINIDKDQLASAEAHNRVMQYSNTFLNRDMNALPLPFKDEEFDGFYQIQAFSLCKDIPALCKELFRVLKPGAKLSLLDWASLQDYDPDDPHHRELMRAIKPLIGAVGTPTPESMATDLASAGFTTIQHYNPSIDGLQVPLLVRAKYYFYTARWTILGLVRLGLLPAHFRTLFNRMTQDSDAFIEADAKRLITTCYHWVAEKPSSGRASPTGSESEAEVGASGSTSGVATPQSSEVSG